MRLKIVKQLFEDPELKTLQLVFLVRDPRAAAKSRDSMDWCVSPTCSDPKVLCDDLYHDYLTAVKIKEKFPDRIHLVRYEDLSLDPYNQMDGILKFLNLPLTPQIDKVIAATTKTRRNDSLAIFPSALEVKEAARLSKNPYSTTRVSRLTAFAWKKEISVSELEEVQNVCTDAMDVFGYNKIKDVANEKNNEAFLPIKPRSELLKLW